MQDRITGLKRMFSLPESVVPLGLVVIGYPAKSVPMQDRYLEVRVHHNKWCSRRKATCAACPHRFSEAGDGAARPFSSSLQH